MTRHTKAGKPSKATLARIEADHAPGGIVERITSRPKDWEPNPWRRNRGKQPVLDGTLVTVRHRDGNILTYPANEFHWPVPKGRPWSGDIMAWRYVEPPEPPTRTLVGRTHSHNGVVLKGGDSVPITVEPKKPRKPTVKELEAEIKRLEASWYDEHNRRMVLEIDTSDIAQRTIHLPFGWRLIRPEPRGKLPT